MTANDTAPSEGESGEEESEKVVGFMHGLTPTDFDLEVTRKGSRVCGYVEFSLRGPPHATTLLSAKQAEDLISELDKVVASMDDACCTEDDYRDVPGGGEESG